MFEFHFFVRTFYKKFSYQEQIGSPYLLPHYVDDEKNKDGGKTTTDGGGTANKKTTNPYALTFKNYNMTRVSAPPRRTTKTKDYHAAKNKKTEGVIKRMINLLRFATYFSTLRRQGEEPAARCNTSLTASNKMIHQTYLLELTMEELLYVDIPVGPSLGEATESFFTSVPLPSDALDRRYIEQARTRREKSMDVQRKSARVGAKILADYGEEGLMEGKIDDVSFLSAKEVSQKSNISADDQKQKEKREEEETNLEAKAIHVTWNDGTVEWIELPDTDVEINPPFCPPQRDNYNIPALLDAVRPGENMSELSTPTMMVAAGTRLLPYQKRFLAWAKKREDQITEKIGSFNSVIGSSSSSSSSSFSSSSSSSFPAPPHSV